MLSVDQCQLLAARLWELDYTVDAVVSAIGEPAHRALGRNQTTPADRCLAGRDDPLACLIRLWLLQQAVSTTELDEALPGLGLVLRRAGIVAVEHDRASAVIDIRPYAADQRAYWICADLTPGLDGMVTSARPDLVLGVSSASTSLAQLTPREPVETAMDLGTGSGVQSLHLAQHAQRIVATDVNPRAMELAELTLQLNAVGGVDLRQGDLFAPVADDRFDLITSNPPYVMSPPGPGSRLAYREGNLSGDALMERIVGQGCEHLRPGGTLAVLGNWAHLAGTDWEDRLAGWIPSGCDAHFVQRELLDPCEYAEIWLADAGLVGSGSYRRHYAEWMDYFDTLGVEAVGLGWILVRNSQTTAASIRIEHWPYAIEQPVAPALVREQDGVELDRRLTDADLLTARWTLVEDVVEESVGSPGAADPHDLVLRQQRGMRRGVQVDTALGGVVGACDGELPLGVLIESVAGLLDVDPAALTDALVPRIRRLAVEGFLRLAS